MSTLLLLCLDLAKADRARQHPQIGVNPDALVVIIRAGLAQLLCALEAIPPVFATPKDLVTPRPFTMLCIVPSIIVSGTFVIVCSPFGELLLTLFSIARCVCVAFLRVGHYNTGLSLLGEICYKGIPPSFSFCVSPDDIVNVARSAPTRWSSKLLIEWKKNDWQTASFRLRSGTSS